MVTPFCRPGDPSAELNVTLLGGLVMYLRPEGKVQANSPWFFWITWIPPWCLMVWCPRQRQPKLLVAVGPPSSAAIV